MLDYKSNRAIKIISNAINKLSLNLTDYIILTEVGSNYYNYTPIIAALANAKYVYAWTRDSQYGSGKEIKEKCMNIAKALSLNDKISITINDKPISQIAEADIITNSGFLRPLNADFLKHVKLNAVIPLMYELWELRQEDIDIEFCKKNQIKVAGTSESNSDINVFGACGALAVKLANEAGYEVYQNNIAVWSNDDFGKVSFNAFKDAKAANVNIYNDYSLLLSDIDKIDFLYICDYNEKRSYFGPKGFMALDELIKKNNSFGVVHLYGDIDNEILKRNNINVYPDKKGYPNVMTCTLGHVGLLPILNLQTAGFKVGQLLKQNKVSNLIQPVY